MLLDPFEEGPGLPAIFVYLSDLFGFYMMSIGNEMIDMAVFRVGKFNQA